MDLLLPVWIRVFMDGSSTLSFISFCRATSWGERRGVTGSAALGGGTTLGGSTLGGGTLGGSLVGDITKVVGGTGLGVWWGGGGVVGDPLFRMVHRRFN